MTHAPDRMRIAVLFCIAIVVTLILTLDAKHAHAVAPTNDVFPSPLVVPSLPFSEVRNTTEATTDADDAQLNFFCGAPATDASVWYAFTPAVDTNVIVDVSQSSYSAGVLVGLGNQAGDFVACGPGAVLFFAAASTTYYVLAIDDQFDGGGNGGSLSISFNVAQAPSLDFTVNRFGQFNSTTGTATISGTYTCSNGDFLQVDGTARQAVGRIATISGSFFFIEGGTCDGTPHPWSAEVFPQSGKFKGGKALTLTFAIACGFGCASTDGYIEKTVQLRGGTGGQGGGAQVAGVDQPGGQLFLPSITARE